MPSPPPAASSAQIELPPIDCPTTVTSVEPELADRVADVGAVPVHGVAAVGTDLGVAVTAPVERDDAVARPSRAPRSCGFQLVAGALKPATSSTGRPAGSPDSR